MTLSEAIGKRLARVRRPQWNPRQYLWIRYDSDGPSFAKLLDGAQPPERVEEVVSIRAIAAQSNDLDFEPFTGEPVAGF